MSGTIEPVEVERNAEERTLRILWEDDHESHYGYDLLRGFCPCAGCQGHFVRAVKFNKPERPVDLNSIEPVGNYALSFLWSDGHTTGIYRFDFLRGLCDCGECKMPRDVVVVVSS